MSLLNTVQAPITLQDKQVAVANEIKSVCSAMFAFNASNFTRIFQMVWNNRNGLTPQQVCDALGTDAGALFTLAGGLQAVINTAKPDSLTLTPPKSVSIGSDGNVTIGV